MSITKSNSTGIQSAKDEADKILGISPEQRRVFNAVAELQDACDEMLLAQGGTVMQDDVFEQMVWSSMLSVYGSSWVTDAERDAAAGAALAVVKAFSNAKDRAYAQMQHDDHKKAGIEEDNDCEICIEILEAKERG